MKNFNQTLLYKKWFLLAVFILLINDFYLKNQFHNVLTGKLSDFAGLFAFSYFLSLFTKRIKVAYYVTFLFFIFWKTEISQSFINFLNSFNLNIYRIVDYSDFIAFLSLPLSYKYRTRKEIININISLLKSSCLTFITCFSFLATTQIPKNSPPIHIEKLNLKSGLIVDFPFNEDTFFDSLGYKTGKPFYRNNGYYIFIEQKKSNSEHINIIYKINILKSKDSSSQIRVDSILDFRYTKNQCNNINDSINRDFFYKKHKKMTKKQFDSIFLSKFEKLNK